MRKAPLAPRVAAQGRLRDSVDPPAEPVQARGGAECIEQDGQKSGGLPCSDAVVGNAERGHDHDAHAKEMVSEMVSAKLLALAMEERFQLPEQELLTALWARAGGLRASRRAQQGRARLERRRQQVADVILESPCDSKFSSFCSDAGSGAAAELAKTRSFG